MKTVYFVRHGQTENNADDRYNLLDTGISEVGRKQADIVAKRCTNLSAEVIVSSTLKRAVQTAQVIAQETSLPHETSDLFRERLLPEKLRGQPRKSAQGITYETTWWKGADEFPAELQDGESFAGLKKRCKDALQYLLTRPEDYIIVVTHGFFLQYLLAYVIFGDSLSGQDIEKVRYAFRMENVGITVLRHEPERKTSTGWSVWIWNDHAHLG